MLTSLVALALVPAFATAQHAAVSRVVLDAPTAALRVGEPAMMRATALDENGVAVPGVLVDLAPTGQSAITDDAGDAIFRVESPSTPSDASFWSNASGATGATAYVLWQQATLTMLTSPPSVSPNENATITLVAELLPNGTPLADAAVGLAQNDTILDASTTDANGSATLATTFASIGTVALRVVFDDPREASADRDLSLVVRAPGDEPPVVGNVSFSYDHHHLTAIPSGVSDPDGQDVTVSYAWRENGQALSDTNATIRARPNATYDVAVTPADASAVGAPTLATFVTPPNQGPIARLLTSIPLMVGEPGTFDASSSIDPDGDITSYSWTFPDGTALSGANVSFTFAANGTQLVLLRLVDDDGGASTTTFPVHVFSPPNVPPRIGGVSIAYDHHRLTANVSNVTDREEEAVTLSYAWRQDGQLLNDTTATIRGVPNATYDVTVTPSDPSAAGDPVSATFRTPANLAPIARAIVSPLPIVIGTPTTFDASTSADPDGDIRSFAWTFGDGSTFTGANFTRTFSFFGGQTVTLAVTDDDGGVTTLSIPITVSPPPSNGGAPAPPPAPHPPTPPVSTNTTRLPVNATTNTTHSSGGNTSGSGTPIPPTPGSGGGTTHGGGSTNATGGGGGTVPHGPLTNLTDIAHDLNVHLPPVHIRSGTLGEVITQNSFDRQGLSPTSTTTTTPTSSVPAPGVWSVALAALAAVAWRRRRSRGQ